MIQNMPRVRRAATVADTKPRTDLTAVWSRRATLAILSLRPQPCHTGHAQTPGAHSFCWPVTPTDTWAPNRKFQRYRKVDEKEERKKEEQKENFRISIMVLSTFKFSYDF